MTLAVYWAVKPHTDKQLEQMNIDLQENQGKCKELLGKEEMKTFIVSTIQALNSELEKKIDKVIEKKVEEKLKEKNEELNSRLDLLVYENMQLKDVESLRSSLNECENYAE